jgi:hypothetical protein
MGLGLVQAFFMGFAIATMLFFLISGLAWIKMTPGMNREDSLALVDLTNGKYMSEIVQEGLMRIKEMTALPKEIADNELESKHTAAEMARFPREVITFYITAGSNGGKKPYLN